MSDVNKCPAPDCDNKRYFKPEEQQCERCGYTIGTINVREAREEEAELRLRYASALARSADPVAAEVLRRFEKSVENDSCVVVNLRFFPFRKIVKERLRYKNHYKMAEEGGRIESNSSRDKTRFAVDALLFGLYAKEIHHGALSLDKRGATSYGPVTLTLKSSNICGRVSFLSQNSFHFAHKRDCSGASRLMPFGELPRGHRSTWKERGKLAAVKYVDDLHSAVNDVDFPRILLQPAFNKESDDFIEAHLYDGFDLDDVDAVNLEREGVIDIEAEVFDDLQAQIEQDYPLRLRVCG